MKQQRIFAIVLSAVLLLNLFAGAAGVRAAEVEDYVWTTGSLDNTHDLIGTVTHDTENTLDGNGATKVVMDTENLGGRVRYSTADGQPVDLSVYNQVTIDLYVSNPEIVYGAGTLMLHRGDAVTEYDLRKVVEADGTISSQYAEGWNRITYDITGDTSLPQMYHIFVWFNWHQDKVPGAYFIVDSITFSKVDNPESKIENLGMQQPENPPVDEPPKTGDTMIDLIVGAALLIPVAVAVVETKKRKNHN